MAVLGQLSCSLWETFLYVYSHKASMYLLDSSFYTLFLDPLSPCVQFSSFDTNPVFVSIKKNSPWLSPDEGGNSLCNGASFPLATLVQTVCAFKRSIGSRLKMNSRSRWLPTMYSYSENFLKPYRSYKRWAPWFPDQTPRYKGPKAFSSSQASMASSIRVPSLLP